MERTLIIVKPDGVQRGLIGRVVTRIEEKGLNLIGGKLMRVPKALAETHYAEHVGKPFYDRLVTYITCGPVFVMAVEGPSAVAVMRAMLGATDGRKSPPGTIRGDFGLSVQYNLVHGSDSVESGQREVALFFRGDELVEGQRDMLKWVWESQE
jgi:nucleoside-diphosphate kinase